MRTDTLIQERADTRAEEMAERVASTFTETFAALIERRDAKYAEATAPLDAEAESLRHEHAAIGEAAENLSDLLPARQRESQRAADVLLLAGKHEEAAAKLEEMREAEGAPEAMRARQSGISARIEAIAGEKKIIAKRVFQEWYGECVTVHRAIERAHFIGFLDGLKQAFFDFEQRTDTFAKGVGDPGLFTVGHLTGLTADERSEEWQAGTRWYAGRGRG